MNAATREDAVSRLGDAPLRAMLIAGVEVTDVFIEVTAPWWAGGQTDGDFGSTLPLDARVSSDPSPPDSTEWGDAPALETRDSRDPPPMESPDWSDPRNNSQKPSDVIPQGPGSSLRVVGVIWRIPTEAAECNERDLTPVAHLTRA